MAEFIHFGRAIYQIKVSGNLDQTWVSWFNQMKITTENDQDEGPITVFTGPVSDQAQLRGLLIRIWDLNLELLSIQKMIGITQLDEGETPRNA